MEARAYLKHVRIPPCKASIVLDLVRGKEIDLTMAILKHTPKTAREDLQKLLKSIVVNAENNYNIDITRLYVVEYLASFDPILKHIRPRAQGHAFRILKRVSHVTLVFKEKE